MAETVPVRKTETVFDSIREMEDRIRQRAHEIFSGMGNFGKDLDNWLLAEKELTWRPAIELTEENNEFRLKIAVPGVDPKVIDIQATADEILVKASTREEREEKKGNVYASELKTGDLFRSVRLPKTIDPNRVKAEVKNGILNLTAPVAEEVKSKKVQIEAA
jgi:HSP20 family protein